MRPEPLRSARRKLQGHLVRRRGGDWSSFQKQWYRELLGTTRPRQGELIASLMLEVCSVNLCSKMILTRAIASPPTWKSVTLSEVKSTVKLPHGAVPSSSSLNPMVGG